NEERTIGACIRKAQACFRSLGIEGEVVVADNGSSDQSIAIAESLGARVVRERRKGYGSALMRGIEAARGEIIVMADADGSYDWGAIGGFVQKIRSGYDVVLGNRFQGGIERGAMPFLNRYVGNPVLSLLARVTHGAPVGDFHCGMRAFTKTAYAKMGLSTPGMEFATEMIVNAARASLRITEIPTPLHRDGRDRASHLRPFRDGWRHLRFILTYAPNYLYLAPGALLMLIGLVLVGALAGGPIEVGGHYVGIHFLALGCMLVLMGFNVIHFGVLAKMAGASQNPSPASRVQRWAVRRFTLEGGLLLGGALFFVGIAIDAYILWKWVGNSLGRQDETVHVAFVATLLVVLGMNTVFSSFLLNMFATAQRARQPQED
ncbi:MAG TPA: glycosyltransferase family 2 protein, partial [Terriglobales bacterium]|nr:glycosyltransferase family 2 protein [Terriglobales bacterium]